MPSLRRSLATARHELRMQFYAPLTYIFQAGFLLVLALCIFQVGDFYASDEASMRLWLVFLPWIGMVFVPAFAMHAWPHEHIDRAVELELTLPLSAGDAVLGKFAAGLVGLLLTLAAGAAFIVTLGYLGAPDWGAVAAALLASFLLLALYLAVTLALAAVVGQAVSVFVLSLLLLFLSALIGREEVNALFAALPGDWLPAMRAVSPKSYFDSVASGLIRASDLGYFVIAVALCLGVCAAALSARRHGRLTGVVNRKFVGIAFACIAAAIGLQTALVKLPLEIDLTEQREFTLSDAARNLIAALPHELRIQFYWSDSQPDIPPAIRAHAKRIRNLLHRIAQYSDAKVQVQTIDPIPDSDAELAAAEAGMRAVRMSSGDYFYLGLAMQYGERARAHPYFDRARERFIEHDLLAAIHRIVEPKVTRIAILSPFIAPSALHNPRPGLAFVEELKDAYDLSVIPFFASRPPADADVLIVMQGNLLKREMLYAIDQHIMRGGGLIAMLDPHVRSDAAGNEVAFQPSMRVNDLSDLLLRYGLHYRGDSIVGDSQLASAVAGDAGRLSYPYWLRWDASQIDRAHAAVAGLHELLFAEAGEFAIVGENARPVLRTTDSSGTYSRLDYARQTAPALAAQFQVQGGRRVIAAAASGALQSAFAAHDFSRRPAHLNATENARVFAIADADWLFDSFALHTMQVDGEVLTRPRNDNLALLNNLIASAAGAELGDVPARGRLSRPFTRAEQLFKRVAQSVRENEHYAHEHIVELESRLAEIRRVAGVQKLGDLPRPLRAQALDLQKQLIAMRRDLREIRRQVRARVERLGRIVAAVNIASGPVLVLLFAAGVMMRRRLRSSNFC